MADQQNKFRGPVQKRYVVRDKETLSIPEDPLEYDADSKDYFANSMYVTNLKMHNFDQFLRQTDVMLVFFYDPMSPISAWSKKHVDRAARSVKREGAGFGGVNCQTETLLCQREGVSTMPFFKIYSRGHKVSSIQEYTTFTYDTMKAFVEKCPILSEPIKAVKKCDR